MIGSTQPIDVKLGSIEQDVLSIETNLENLGSLIVHLESSLYQVLRADDCGAGGMAIPSPSTPLASRLCDVSSGVSNLSGRVAQLISRVDI